MSQPDSPKTIFGFGVRPVTLKPTLLKINYLFYGQRPWYVSMFTLSPNSWNNLENYCLPRESIRIKQPGQAVVGGKILWAGSERMLFTIPFLVEHVLKLLRFSKDEKPIVEANSSQDITHSLQDELEPEEVEGAKLEEQLLQPPAAPTCVPAGRQSTHPAPRKNTAEEDELAKLQAEMAL
ncbi:hypothetical protein Tco_1362881 [Tanacetum coccineum]